MTFILKMMAYVISNYIANMHVVVDKNVIVCIVKTLTDKVNKLSTLHSMEEPVYKQVIKTRIPWSAMSHLLCAFTLRTQ